LAILPIYFIMGAFNLDQMEKIVFSIFLSVGIFPIFVYWLGILMSFTAGIFITTGILVAIGLLVRMNKKNNN